MAITKEQAEALKRPFDPAEIEWRVGQAGRTSGRPWVKVLAYLTSRAVMERLDEVFGVGGWSHSVREINLGELLDNKGKPFPVRGIVCTLAAGGVEHDDVAESSDIEPLKGAASGALKRAAVHFGIGRYLYYLEDGFGKIHENGRFKHYGKDKEGNELNFRWDPPALPAWALPSKDSKPFNPYPSAPQQPDPVDDSGDGLVIPKNVPEAFVADVRRMLTGRTPESSLAKAIKAATAKAESLGMTVQQVPQNNLEAANLVLAIKSAILDAEPSA